MHELDSWREEKRSAYLYRVVAQAEAGTVRAGLFKELADSAEKQAAIWAKHAQSKGATVPGHYTPDLRATNLSVLVVEPGAAPAGRLCRRTVVPAWPRVS